MGGRCDTALRGILVYHKVIRKEINSNNAEKRHFIYSAVLTSTFLSTTLQAKITLQHILVKKLRHQNYNVRFSETPFNRIET